ncbi:MAG: tetratricopeptide repeat protein [Elusimicrobiota bacterium]|jgi:predicted negative regulator of RcsB-dependent stress response|nr:tetratricopeptide repeat protein [Elusimicrobiota bacterium]
MKNKMTKETKAPSQHGIIDLAVKAAIKNRKQILITLIVILVATAAICLFNYHKNKTYQAQWAGLFKAELALMNSSEQPMAPLQDFAAKYKDTEAGAYGAFILGNAYYQMKDYAKAEEYFKQVMSSQNKEFATLGEISLAAALLAQNNYPQTSAQVDSFAAKYPTHFALGQMLQYKALAQELGGKKDLAKETYQKIMQDYPNTYYFIFAQARLKELK